MGLKLAIAGATGLVGRELISIIEREGPQLEKLGLYASEASSGTSIAIHGQNATVLGLAECDFSSYDAAFFCVGDELSASFVPRARKAGCAVVDKSNAYRMDSAVPLVVPRVNSGAVTATSSLVANPNCTTTVLCHAIGPLHRRFGIQRLFAATYQSVSGSGKGGVAKLTDQLEIAGSAPPDQPYLKLSVDGVAYNVLSQIGGLDGEGRASEEAKLVNETRKILDAPQLPIHCHAVRVPVYVGHSIAVTLELAQQAEEQDILAAWQAAPDVLLKSDGLPTPVGCSRHNQVEVGRLRRELGQENIWSFFVCGDNLRIGAALNGWRILELMQNAGVIPKLYGDSEVNHG